MPAKSTDSLVGRTYGDWTVTAFSHKDGDTKWWRVTCTCGTERVQRGWVLTMGKSTCCGDCSARKLSELHLQRQAERWIGTETGGWVIVAYSGVVEIPREKITMWVCRCLTCGAVIDAPRTDIHKPTMPVCRHGVFPPATPANS
jgi:hypothetical protein